MEQVVSYTMFHTGSVFGVCCFLLTDNMSHALLNLVSIIGAHVMSGKAVIEDTPTGTTLFRSKYSCFMKTMEKYRFYEVVSTFFLLLSALIMNHWSGNTCRIPNVTFS